MEDCGVGRAMVVVVVKVGVARPRGSGVDNTDGVYNCCAVVPGEAGVICREGTVVPLEIPEPPVTGYVNVVGSLGPKHTPSVGLNGGSEQFKKGG